MEISEVRLHEYETKGPSAPSHPVTTLVVEVRTDWDVTGWGEVVPGRRCDIVPGRESLRSAFADLAPSLIGLDPRRSSTIRAELQRVATVDGGVPGSLDVACWDIAAKSYDESLCDVLGGSAERSVRAAAPLPAAGVAKAPEQALHRQADGFTRLVAAAGVASVGDDIDAVMALAEVVEPQTRLLVDPNGRWTSRDTIEFSRACKEISLSLLQPGPSHDDHRAMGARLHHPLFLLAPSQGDRSFLHLIADGVAQGICLQLGRSGGLTSARTLRDMCIESSLPLVIDASLGGQLAAAEAVHLAASIPDQLAEGVMVASRDSSRRYATSTPTVRPKNGRIAVPRGAGLGVEPDTAGRPEPVAVYS